jgi:hypothetical protein
MHHFMATSKRQGALKAPAAGENREIGLTSFSIIVSSLKVSGPER